MEKTDKKKSIKDYLHTIERTRLLRNTSEELGELVGFSIAKGNGLARMGGKSPFIKDAIFRELAYIVYQETELDLQEVLDVYDEADSICEDMKKTTDPASFCRNLVRYFYADEEATDDINPYIEDIQPKHIPILVLLMLKLLPRCSAKGGDISQDEIKENYLTLFDWMTDIVKENAILQELPMLAMMKEKVRDDANIMCRIHLIYTTNLILNSYGALSTKERAGISNTILQENRFDPEIEGIWVENDATTVFWLFERIVNGYHLYRYQLNSKRKVLMFTKYFMIFQHYEKNEEATVIHPQTAQYLVTGKKIPNRLIAHLNFQKEANHGNKQEDTLSFNPQAPCGSWFKLKHLKRSINETSFRKKLEHYEQIDSNPDDDYTFTIALAAITHEHLYIHKDGKNYYKVPKSTDDLLSSIGIDSNVGILEFSKTADGHSTTYLGFDDVNLYYDVSTPEAMAEHQIEIVDNIVV